MDARLAPELGLDRLDRQAPRLLAAVAAPLADALVDQHLLRRIGRLPALARAAQIRGTRLIVDQHGDAGDLRELALGREQTVAAAHLGAGGECNAVVTGRILGRDHDPLHALGVQAVCELANAQLALDVLAARHRDGVVVEQLVGHVEPGSDRGADRERAGVVEGAVADVLDEVARGDERGCADPLRALASHLRDAGHLAAPDRVEHHHRVAADACSDDRIVVRDRAARVRTPRAEERRALRSEMRGGPRGDRVELEQASAHSGVVGERQETRADRSGDGVAVERAGGRDQRAAALVALADDPWRRRDPVERLLDQALEERPLLLDHEHLVQAGGEAAERVLVERVEHPDLQDPYRRCVAEAEVHERLAQVVVGGARGDDPEPGAGPVVCDRVEPVQARVLPGKLEPDTGQRALELERLRREQVRRWPVHVGPAVPLEHRRQRRHAVESDLDRGGRVGNRRHDLERRPETRGARARDRVPPQIERPPARCPVRTRERATRRAATPRRPGSSTTCTPDRRRTARARRHADRCRRSCRGGSHRQRGRLPGTCRTRRRARRRSAGRAASRRAGSPTPPWRPAPR